MPFQPMSRVKEALSRVDLRTRLVLHIILTLLPLVALVLNLIDGERRDHIALASERALSLTRDGARSQTDLIEQARGVLQVLSHVPAVRDRDPRVCSNTLAELRPQFPWMTGLSVVAPNGLIVCDDTGRSVGIADRPYFREAQRTREFVLSDFIIGRMSGKPVVIALLPVLDDEGEVRSYMLAGIDLAWIGRVAAEAAHGTDGIVLVVDRHGTVLAREPDPTHYVGRSAADHPLVRRMQEQDHGTFESTGLDGVERIYGYSTLGNTGARVSIGFARETVVADVNREMTFSLAVLAAVTLASALGGWVLVEMSVIRWVRHLQDATRQISAGNFEPAARVPRMAGEMGDLGKAFNRMARELGNIAHLDRLTQLPNRRFLDQYLDGAAEDAGTRRLALMYIDLDGFKPVNDRLGHHVGDALLVEVAARLAGCIRADDIAARLGGDEFAFILNLRGSERDARAVAAEAAGRIVAAMSEPFDIDGTSIGIGCSVGVSLWPDDAPTPQAALRHADSALYEAKRAGKNRVALHETA